MEKNFVQNRVNFPKAVQYADQIVNGERTFASLSGEINDNFINAVKTELESRGYLVVSETNLLPEEISEQINQAQQEFTDDTNTLIEEVGNIGVKVSPEIVSQVKQETGFEKDISELKNKIIESFKGIEYEIDLSDMPLIPLRWKSFLTDPDLLEEMWTFTIPINESEYEKLKLWKKRGLDYAREYTKKVKNNLIDKDRNEVVEKVEQKIFSENIVEQEIILPSIERKKGIVAVGDLNGSYKGFVDHLIAQGCIITNNDNSLTWTGGDKKVVFVGDILGDRSPEGMQVYEGLKNIQDQAVVVGGSVEWLSGNHENMFNAVLCGFTTEKGKNVHDDMSYRLSSYSGNLELLRLIPELELSELLQDLATQETSILDNDFHATLTKKRKDLNIMKNNTSEYSQHVISTLENSLNKLLKSEEAVHDFKENFEQGRIQDAMNNLFFVVGILGKKYQNKIGEVVLKNRDIIKDSINNKPENISFKDAFLGQKLVTIIDDSLYVHTSLTTNMIKTIKDFSGDSTIIDGINKINSFYQETLKIYLEQVEPEKYLTPDQINYFNILRDEFISTSSESRENFSETTISDQEKEELKQFLKSNGINIVIHGHNDENGQLKGFSDLPIISIDRSVYKSESVSIEIPLAYMNINTDGIVRLPE